ncbi:MAG: lysophospholipid acyltransferase family protein [Candidatus Kapaibacteriota bacterium]
MKAFFDLLTYPLRLLFVILITILDSSGGLLGMIFFPKFYFKLNHYRSWAKRLLFFAGIKVVSVGVERLEPKASYVFVANHSSYLDIPALFVAIPNNLRIMYKRELEKIPFFGWFLKKSDFIAIEREEIASARGSLNKALELIQQDVSVLIFPEGTRSLDGSLREFKKGALYLAVRSGKPIVPVAISGTNKLLPRGGLLIRTGQVKVTIGEPLKLSTTGGKAEIERITKTLHDKIYEMLIQS